MTLDPSKDDRDLVRAQASAIEAIARDILAGGGSIEDWRTRVAAVIGRACTRLPILKHGRRPAFFSDDPVRECLIELHRCVPLATAVKECRSRFGDERTPSRSAISRFWLYLDRLQGRLMR